MGRCGYSWTTYRTFRKYASLAALAGESRNDEVLLARQDAVATVTLLRPALTTAVKVALREALSEVARDKGVRAVVLTGTGKAFRVGQDLAEHAEALRAGPAVRVTAETARFGTAFTGIGLTCDSGLLILFGSPFTAAQAAEWASRDASCPPGRWPRPLEDVLRREGEAQTRLGGSEEHRKAVDAFLAKETPVSPVADTGAETPRHPELLQQFPRHSGVGGALTAGQGGRETSPPGSPSSPSPVISSVNTCPTVARNNR